jgi:broad specificity phosphatase PhoE
MRQNLWLLRHAESEWNAAGRWQGRADPSLSRRGEAQARDIAEQLAASLSGERIVRLYCSIQRRAVQTARAVGARLGLEPVEVADLQELDVGRWTGLSTEEIRAREPDLLEAFEAGDLDVAPGGGETRRQLRSRVARAAAERAPESADESVLFVVHLGVVRALVPGAEPTHVELVKATFDAVGRLDATAGARPESAPL